MLYRTQNLTIQYLDTNTIIGSYSLEALHCSLETKTGTLYEDNHAVIMQNCASKQ